ncbi:MAG: helix-turn-helix domain-containing protein [Ruminococcus sp.]|nr:helix-turn-helix domain-containing protein [Ruminococcus sp.]
MFFDQLTKACHMRNITVTSLTQQLKISKSNVTHWKNGTFPNSEVVIRISEFLGVPTDFLLKGDKENIAETIIGTNNQNPTINKSQNVEVNGIKNDSILNASLYAKQMSFEHIEIKSGANLSGNEKELVRIFESLPIKEQIKLMNMVYEFDETYRNHDK